MSGQPFYKGMGGGRPAAGRPDPAAPLSGGLRGRPPRCRATGPPGARAQIFRKTFCRKAPAVRQRGGGVYCCKFRKQKYIFIKNEIEKYKNKKIARPVGQRAQIWMRSNPISPRSAGPPHERRNGTLFAHLLPSPSVPRRCANRSSLARSFCRDPSTQHRPAAARPSTSTRSPSISARPLHRNAPRARPLSKRPPPPPTPR